jgi:hypothetical protein
MASFRGLVLQRPHQCAKHFSQALALGENWLQIEHWHDTDTFCQKQMRFQFRQGALRDSQMLNEVPGVFSPVTFGNVGRD